MTLVARFFFPFYFFQISEVMPIVSNFMYCADLCVSAERVRDTVVSFLNNITTLQSVTLKCHHIFRKLLTGFKLSDAKQTVMSWQAIFTTLRFNCGSNVRKSSFSRENVSRVLLIAWIYRAHTHQNETAYCAKPSWLLLLLITEKKWMHFILFLPQLFK